ncbi:hypothetical protein BAUCODRAFT_333384 [Baudoinia panamericana UAMH 10762]|uniref:Uncharacterized protein n=1 Tax=Baudoinia panamericana (strain UAMH 10762) TaxID=717646 RepID=M2M3E5_BAUPA|nr:uncharacterized protein BAUCODRAFT_333384 [Baudoinia panamericana UAMH 10762]EMC91046.1 hypothetical protein BAUCODRAFT_333384 [Baudoinia panamericana UAMH 10762]
MLRAFVQRRSAWRHASTTFLSNTLTFQATQRSLHQQIPLHCVSQPSSVYSLLRTSFILHCCSGHGDWLVSPAVHPHVCYCVGSVCANLGRRVRRTASPNVDVGHPVSARRRCRTFGFTPVSDDLLTHYLGQREAMVKQRYLHGREAANLPRIVSAAGEAPHGLRQMHCVAGLLTSSGWGESCKRKARKPYPTCHSGQLCPTSTLALLSAHRAKKQCECNAPCASTRQ